MSLSEAAGHLSFMFLGMGFLETDLLPLRVYAAAGEGGRDIKNGFASDYDGFLSINFFVTEGKFSLQNWLFVWHKGRD